MKSEIQKVELFISKMRFTNHETYRPDPDNGAVIPIINTKCNELTYEDFQEYIYELIENLTNSEIESIGQKYFESDRFKGKVIESRTVSSNSNKISEHVQVASYKLDQTILPEKFINFLQKIFMSESSSSNISSKLVWNGSAVELGFIIRYLCDEGLVVTPKKGMEVNCQELGKQVLNSFKIKSKLQNIRKQVDPDQTKLSSEKQNQFREDLHEIIKSLTE